MRIIHDQLLDGGMWVGTELFSGSFGENYNQDDVNDIVSCCLELGINKFDTAECYGNAPPVESLLGNAIAGRRQRLTIATKFGHQVENGSCAGDFQVELVEEQLHRSLDRLKTDYIDLYYFHSGGNEEFCNDALWSMLHRKKEAGIIGKLGLSIKHALVMEKNYVQLDKAQEYNIEVIQTVLNMYSRQSLEHVVPMCRSANMVVLGRMPLAKGLLAGKYNSAHKFDAVDQRAATPQLNKIITEKFPDITAKRAIQWCLEYVDGVVLGSKNTKQLKENFSIVNKSLKEKN